MLNGTAKRKKKKSLAHGNNFYWDGLIMKSNSLILPREEINRPTIKIVLQEFLEMN